MDIWATIDGHTIDGPGPSAGGELVKVFSVLTAGGLWGRRFESGRNILDDHFERKGKVGF